MLIKTYGNFISNSEMTSLLIGKESSIFIQRENEVFTGFEAHGKTSEKFQKLLYLQSHPSADSLSHFMNETVHREIFMNIIL